MADCMLPERPGSGTMPRVVLDPDTYNEIDDQFAVADLFARLARGGAA